MCNAAGKLAQSLQLLRLEQRFLRLPQFKFGLLFLSDVAGDLREADMFASFIVDRIDQDMRPK